MPKAKLRTKTGCITCRRRKLKCDESRPHCRQCFLAHRQCEWPAVSELYDRRYHCHTLSRYKTARDQDDPISSDYDSEESTQASPLQASALILRNPKLETTICTNSELSLFRYYLDTLLSFLLSPEAHPGFFAEYLPCVARYTLTSPSVKCAVLACCASNKYQLTGDVQFRKLSLKYYCQAVQKVNSALAELHSTGGCPDDALLTAVIHMYINALWGSDVTNDAPEHVRGAVQLMKLRYAKSPLSMASPFNRVTAESVVYQSFLLEMRHPFQVDFQVDNGLLIRSGNALDSLTFMDASPLANNPVLGVPLSLYRLISEVMQLYQPSKMVDFQSFSRVKRDMEHWEHVATQMDEERGSQSTATAREPSPSNSAPEYSHADAMILYTLAGSLLLDWIIELNEKEVPSQSELDSRQQKPRIPPRASGLMPPPPRRGSQLVRALSILRRPETYKTWTRSHLGWWPVSIFGLAADQEEDISLIKDVLLCTRQRLGYGLVDRVLADLEQVWEQRSNSQHIPKVEAMWVEDSASRPASPFLVN